jgi:hypothetical protein
VVIAAAKAATAMLQAAKQRPDLVTSAGGTTLAVAACACLLRPLTEALLGGHLYADNVEGPSALAACAATVDALVAGRAGKACAATMADAPGMAALLAGAPLLPAPDAARQLVIAATRIFHHFGKPHRSRSSSRLPASLAGAVVSTACCCAWIVMVGRGACESRQIAAARLAGQSAAPALVIRPLLPSWQRKDRRHSAAPHPNGLAARE